METRAQAKERPAEAMWRSQTTLNASGEKGHAEERVLCPSRHRGTRNCRPVPGFEDSVVLEGALWRGGGHRTPPNFALGEGSEEMGVEAEVGRDADEELESRARLARR